MKTEIKYKNYEIKKLDQSNWTLTRHDNVIAERDITNPRTGETVTKKGESYEKKTFLGYYPDIESAAKGIIKDLQGQGCKTLEDVVSQTAALRQDIKNLLEA